MTLASQHGTLQDALSYAAPRVSSVSMAHVHAQSVQLRGAGMGAYDSSAAGRAGLTACEATAWAADSAATCLRARGPGGALRAVVSVQGRAGSSAATLAFVPDGSVLSAATAARGAAQNLPLGRALVEMTLGAGYDARVFSAAARVGGSACARWAWQSDSAVTCRISPGVASARAAVLTAALQARALNTPAPDSRAYFRRRTTCQ